MTVTVENSNIPVIAKKRGRRSKKDIAASKLLLENTIISQTQTPMFNENNIELQICTNTCDGDVNDNKNITDLLAISDENMIVKPGAKKRGRKPKGGKIILQTTPIVQQKEVKPNIILHLKCSKKDLLIVGDYNSNFTNPNIESYNIGSKNDLFYEIINNPDIQLQNNDNPNEISEYDNDNCCETKEIWRKLKVLEHNLHVNNISDKKSACFWCTHDFDNPPIYIPKHFIKNSYHVYGCFCSPECATAHLMEENIDSSTKFERYHLINHIYSKIYEYKKNIKPAPNPHYMLEKYYGNLTIQEYRTLLKSERLFLIVDKPLTRILPEFHEDNDEFIINSKIIPSNNYQVKKRLQKKSQTKNNILNEKFS